MWKIEWSNDLVSINAATGKYYRGVNSTILLETGNSLSQNSSTS